MNKAKQLLDLMDEARRITMTELPEIPSNVEVEVDLGDQDDDDLRSPPSPNYHSEYKKMKLSDLSNYGLSNGPNGLEQVEFKDDAYDRVVRALLDNGRRPGGRRGDVEPIQVIYWAVQIAKFKEAEVVPLPHGIMLRDPGSKTLAFLKQHNIKWSEGG